MKKPLISVVIPCHNQEKYLEKCLLSITEGGISDYEIIAVDDGSTDGTPEILSAFSKKCNRMRTVSLDGRGAGAARNLGMKYALGEFILFMDSDDLIVPTYLEDLLEVLVEYPDLDVVCGGRTDPAENTA